MGGLTLCVLGCGTMGRSILTGIFETLREVSTTTSHVTSSSAIPKRFVAAVRSKATADRLTSEFQQAGYMSELDIAIIHGESATYRAVAEADVVLLGTKPQVASALFTSGRLGALLEGKLLISILAGTTIAQLESWVSESCRVVRVMPNTPSRIRQGMSVIVPSPRFDELSRPPSRADTPASSGILPARTTGNGTVTAESGRPIPGLELVQWAFDSVGRTLILEESKIDAATALCGSGPAFMAVILESMTDGGVMMGIPRAQAQLLAAQTMLGTAQMVLENDTHPALIRAAVATPGGCTIGGLLEMEDGKIRSTVAVTIQTAANIAAGLGR